MTVSQTELPKQHKQQKKSRKKNLRMRVTSLCMYVCISYSGVLVIYGSYSCEAEGTTTKPIEPFSCTPHVQQVHSKAEIVHLTPGLPGLLELFNSHA